MLKLLIFLIFQYTLFASNILLLKDTSKKINASSFTYILQDKSSIFNAKDILNSKMTTLYSKSGHSMIKKGPFWTKLILKNDTKKRKSLIIYNQLPGTNYIDIYLYKHNLLEKKYLLGDMREQKDKSFVNRFSIFELSLAPKEQITLVSKIDNFSFTNIAWIIEEPKNFIQSESKFLIIFSLVGGIFTIFIVITFLLYLFYKQFTYLIISIYILNTFLYQFALQGIFYTLDIGLNLDLNTLIAWASPILGAILPLVFTYYFFNMKIKYKKLSLLLLFLVFLNILFLISLLYAFFIDTSHFATLTFLIGILYFISLIFLLGAGLYIKEVGSKFYLIGQSILLITVILNALAPLNFIEYNHIHRYAITIAILLEIILFFIAQSLKTYNNLQELSKAKFMLIEQSRFSSMGQAIGHITHQWKHPLTLTGTSVTLLETILKHDKKNILAHLEKELPLISESVAHMKKTMSELSNFYSGGTEKSSFSPIKTILNVTELLQAKTTLKNANIILDIDKNLEIYNYEHIFSNIIIVLLDNSLDAFKYQNTNTVTISIEDIPDEIVLTYIDNAGGIKIEPIEDIFEYFITSKDKGQGIGLALVKMLIKERLHGSIFVQNIKNGVEFKIHFKK